MPPSQPSNSSFPAINGARYAAITGWGKCLPPAVLSNADLATFIDTDDDWITSRTGMKERRVAHVQCTDMAHIAALRALAAAGRTAQDLDLIIFGSCTGDTVVPTCASRVQDLLGAKGIASLDLNTACTSGLYALSVASSMIKTGSAKRVLVIGAEKPSALMDWTNRNVAVLFGDGAAALIVEGSEQEQGLMAESLGCYAEARDSLAVHNYGTAYTNMCPTSITSWDFDGQDIFKRAVKGMVKASHDVLNKLNLGVEDIDTLVPHQANSRIIDAVGKKLGVPADKVFVNVERYGNMSAATVMIALCEAIEEGKVKPGANILLPAFGAGLTWNSHFIRWGERVEPLGYSDAELPACKKTALEIIAPRLEAQRKHAQSEQASSDKTDNQQQNKNNKPVEELA
ncbi:MAG: ketoacyl-ACP synthase III [Gammaproteobacteria bacterium]|nr:ketoacyl-ACP synthase III [Gammaproteobacteria bacterium]NND38084.1 ketoacyl-ACP synthase III [Pseudomonadales bacterium]MBT8151315.1 ketoacyl-ACP synthase III [Gammaproteobacteria bacterium]NNL10330.1 ketoacyl-ACP synthase III [Pseudomonadales bacterium]NNM10892.1 ketoacyl-ACP synthase III [Pseudomonadales bacterium]